MNTAKPPKRSMKLSPENKGRLKRFIAKCDSLSDAAEKLGISRQSLNRILNAGSARQTVVENIISVISK